MSPEQEMQESPLRQDLFIDPMTGALHRKPFLDEIERHLASGRAFQLLMFNIIGFQYFNGCCGYVEGDRFLQKAAKAISTVMPPEMPIFRIGGDDFAVFGDDRDQTALLCLAEAVRAAIEEIEVPPPSEQESPFREEPSRLPILSLAVSSAIVRFPRDFDSMEAAKSVITEALNLSPLAAPFSCLVYEFQRESLLSYPNLSLNHSSGCNEG